MDTASQTDQPRSISRKRAAVDLDISERTLDRMIAAGEIKSVKISARRRIIPNSEILRLLGAATA